MKCAIYCRLSMDQNGVSTSTYDQLREAREYVTRQGWELVGEFVDNDVSATSGRPRPAWERLLKLFPAKAGDDATNAPDVIVCWAVDRLYRRPRDLERIIERVEHGTLTVKGLHSAEMDLSTPAGRATARTLVAWDLREVEELQQRVNRGLESKALSGDFGWGGERPFGYRVLEADGSEASGRRRRNDPPRHLDVDPAEAASLRNLYAAVLDGRTLKSLARELNQRSVTTTRGNAWTATSLRQTLLAPRNAGLRLYRGEIVGKAKWQPVVDRRTWNKAVKVLTDPKRTVTNRGTRYLLAGRIFCECDARLIGRPMKGVQYYVCVAGTERRTKAEKRGQHVKSAGTPKRVHLGIRADTLDEYVLERAWSVESTEPTVVRDPAESSESLLAERDAIDERISHWNREAAKAGLTAAEIVSGRVELIAERERVEAEMEAIATTAEPGVYERLWAEINRDPRAVIETVVDRVIVSSAGGRGRWTRIADRVQIAWRDGVFPPTEADLAEARKQARGVPNIGKRLPKQRHLEAVQ